MKYMIDIEWSGYSRGTRLVEVEASSEEEARENWYSGTVLDNTVVRDDTEKEILDVIVPSLLDEAEIKLAARKCELSEAKITYEKAKAEWEEHYGDYIDEYNEAKRLEAESKEELKSIALQMYAENPENKTLSDYTKIRIVKTVEYDEGEAIDWAVDHGIAIALDKKLYESMLKDGKVSMPGEVEEVPQVTISSKL